MTIETNGYVATVKDIQALARDAVEAGQGLEGTRATYLRALIGTVQAELKAEKGIEALAALSAVHKRFYEAVLGIVVTADIQDTGRLKPEEKKRRALERNRRSNFARSAYSTLKAWLKVEGHDIADLIAAKATKGQLIEQTPRAKRKAHAMDPAKVRARVEVLVDKVIDQTKGLAGADPTEARAVLDAALQRIAKALFDGAVQPTTDAQTAAREHRPLRAANVMFWPTETPVIRRSRIRLAA